MDYLFNVDQIVEWLRSFGLWAILISLLLSIIIGVLGVVPSLFISGANAVIFGLIPGFIISLIGEVLGAAVSFWLYRWGFSKLKPVKQGTWEWLHKLNEAGRKRRALILLFARMTPLVPSGVITFAAAISKMHFVDFIIVTFLGKMPSIILETFVGHDLIRINENYPRLIVSGILLVIVYLLFRYRKA